MRLNEENDGLDDIGGDAPVWVEQSVARRIERLSESTCSMVSIWVRNGRWTICVKTAGGGEHKHFEGATQAEAMDAAEKGTVDWDRVGPPIVLEVYMGGAIGKATLRLSNATLDIWAHYSTVYQN